MPRIGISDRWGASIEACPSRSNRLRIGGRFLVECFDARGRLRWTEEMKNLVVNVGLNNVLDVYFGGSAQTNPWYVGITNASPAPAAGDTMASHSGWTEFTSYSEANRPEYIESAASGGSISNSSNRAVFSINASGTVGGAFLTSSNTKGGTTGLLFSVGPFSGGNRSVANTDVVRVTYTVTAADDGV